MSHRDKGVFIPGGTRCPIRKHHRVDDFIFDDARFLIAGRLDVACVSLMATLGLIEEGTSCVHVISSDAVAAMSLLELGELKRDISQKSSIILHDETGRCDDIALLRSESIQWIREKDGLRLLPPELKLSLSEEERKLVPDWRIDELSRVAGWALMNSLFDHRFTQPMPISASFRPDQIEGALSAITDGRIEMSVPGACDEIAAEISGMDLDQMFAHLNGIEWRHIPAIAREGLIPLDADEQYVIDNLDALRDVFRLWGHAMDCAGIFIGRNPDERKQSPIARRSFSHEMDMGALRKLASAIGMHELVDAYLSGVPVEDIMA